MRIEGGWAPQYKWDMKRGVKWGQKGGVRVGISRRNALRGGPLPSGKYSSNQYQSIRAHLSRHSKHNNTVLSRGGG